MQKKIIALAVAGLVSGVAFAQSNVTIYGRMDAGFASVKSNLDGQMRSTGVYTGGLTTPRIGFKGEEALGNGLKAIFVYETAASNDRNSNELKDANGNGAGKYTNTYWGDTRLAYTGLAGSFGQVRIGVVGTPTDDWNGNEGETGSLGNLSARNFAGELKGRFAGTKDQGIQYVSPTFSGFTFGAAVIFLDEGNNARGDKTGVLPADANGKRDTLYNIGVTYKNGPLQGTITYAYDKQSEYGVNLKGNKQQYALGLGYDFGVVKVQGSYEAVKNADYVKNDADNNLYTLGVIVPVSKMGKVSFGYAQQDNDAKDNDGKGYVLAYEHSMSKRTTLYTAFFRGTNEKVASNKVPGRFGETAVGSDSKYNGIALGMRHDF